MRGPDAAPSPLRRSGRSMFVSFSAHTRPVCGSDPRLGHWAVAGRVVAGLALIGFAIYESQSWLNAFREPVWTEFDTQLDPWPFPQVLMCPQYVEPGDESSARPGAIEVQECRFWGGHSTQWWDRSCLASAKRVQVQFFNRNYTCTLLNSDASLTGVVPRSILKFNVSIRDSVVDDGTIFNLMGLYDTDDDSYLSGDLVDGQVMTALSAGIKHKVYISRHKYKRFVDYKLPRQMFNPWPEYATTTTIEVDSIDALPMIYKQSNTGPTPRVDLPTIVVELIMTGGAMTVRNHTQTVTFNTLAFIAALGGAAAAVKYLLSLYTWWLKNCVVRRRCCGCCAPQQATAGAESGKRGVGLTRSQSDLLRSPLTSHYGAHHKGTSGGSSLLDDDSSAQGPAAFGALRKHGHA